MCERSNQVTEAIYVCFYEFFFSFCNTLKGLLISIRVCIMRFACVVGVGRELGVWMVVCEWLCGCLCMKEMRPGPTTVWGLDLGTWDVVRGGVWWKREEGKGMSPIKFLYFFGLILYWESRGGVGIKIHFVGVLFFLFSFFLLTSHDHVNLLYYCC